MKKVITLLLTISMVAAMSVTVFADEINQVSNPTIQDTQITTIINPTYAVIIPADTRINFNAKSAKIGAIEATHMQIEPNYSVKVSADVGELKKKADETKKISYKLMNNEKEFTPVYLSNTTEKTELLIAITEKELNASYAGDYQATITFILEYGSFSARAN